MTDGPEMPRREFMAVGALALGGASGGVQPQVAVPDDLQETANDNGFVAAPQLLGALEDRPAPGDAFFDNKTGVYIYLTDGSGDGDGESYWLAVEDGELISGWNLMRVGVPLTQHAQADLPTDTATGTLFFDTSRGIPAWWDRDHYDWVSFVDNQDVLLSPQTVANTTTQTDVYSITFNSGSLIQGRVYQLDLMGTFSTANTSDQFTVVIDLGGTEMAALTNEPDNASGAPWSMETTYTVRSHGTTGQIQPHSRGVFDSVTRDDHHPTATIDTTIAETLTVAIKWDAADPDNSATLAQAHLKQMA